MVFVFEGPDAAFYLGGIVLIERSRQLIPRIAYEAPLLPGSRLSANELGHRCIY